MPIRNLGARLDHTCAIFTGHVDPRVYSEGALQPLANRMDAGRALATATAWLCWRHVPMAPPPLTTDLALTTDDADADADNADDAA